MSDSWFIDFYRPKVVFLKYIKLYCLLHLIKIYPRQIPSDTKLCWKETLLVTNTETQRTTEHAENSACDILTTWAHGGGLICRICCRKLKGSTLAAAVSSTSMSLWWVCSVFLSTVEQRLPLHQQLSISLLKFFLSLHLPLHVLPQSLKHKLKTCKHQWDVLTSFF